jgi:diadenylate cyclase
VEELITGGVIVESEPSPELLMSIVHKESPLHDGALLIRRGRISKAACYLPLSSVEGLPKEWGTRHRAALGLSERCDALVVVISEERGEISVAQGRQMILVKNIEQLSKLVNEAQVSNGPAAKSWPEIILSLTVHR